MSKRSFKQMTQGMTFAEKWEYLWEYYRWILLVAAFGAVIVAMVVTGIVNNSGKIFYSGATVNVQVSEAGEDFLTNGLEETLNAPKKEKAKLFVTSFQDLQNTSDVEMNASAAFQVMLMSTAEEFDYVLMDEVAYDLYKNHPVFTPLDQLFDDAVLEQWAEATVYHETQEEGRYPIALDITDTAFIRDCASVDGRVYIAFPGNTDRNDRHVQFLEYLLSWK